MANLARRYTQDLAVAADDGDRRRRHRRRNLFARADRSLERVTGAGDKLYRAMARRRCAALPPPWLSSVPAIGFVQVWFSPAQGRFAENIFKPSAAHHEAAVDVTRPNHAVSYRRVRDDVTSVLVDELREG